MGGAMEQFEPERLDRLQQGHDGMLPRPTPLGRARVELDIGEHVVGEHHELLPGAIGCLATCSDHGIGPNSVGRAVSTRRVPWQSGFETPAILLGIEWARPDNELWGQ